MQKIRRIEQYLREYGRITSLEIMQLVYSLCPHTIIRALRKKHGADAITDEWCEKTNINWDDKGKQYSQTIRYKRYYWNQAA